MQSNLPRRFNHSDVTNPYAVYRAQLERHPIVFDEQEGLWVVYSYDACKRVLENSHALIPSQHADANSKLSQQAQAILNHLVRLQNPPKHAHTRRQVSRLFNCVETVCIADLLEPLLHAPHLDWVDVSKQLPALALLKGFGFSDTTARTLQQHIPTLCYFMQPTKSPEVICQLNNVTDKVYDVVAQYITSALLVDVKSDEVENDIVTLTANLIGFCIQSYDAGRGMFSNALLQVLRHTDASVRQDKDQLHKAVVESVRFDPAIHNTKRVLTQACEVVDQQLVQGDTMLIVLAAANRDPQQFETPQEFLPERSNNAEHLTFGAGAHACLAKHYMTELVTRALEHLFKHYPNAHLSTDDVQYESLVKARLPVHLPVVLS
jgi:cytochrome P450